MSPSPVIGIEELYKRFQERRKREYHYPHKCLKKMAHAFVQSNKSVPKNNLSLLLFSLESIIIHDFKNQLKKTKREKELAQKITNLLIISKNILHSDLKENIDALFKEKNLLPPEKESILKEVIDLLTELIFELEIFSNKESYHEMFNELVDKRKIMIEVSLVMKNRYYDDFKDIW